MSDLTLSEKIRVRAAICETVDLSLSRDEALALVKILERETDVADTLDSMLIMLADNEVRQARRDKLMRELAIQYAVFYAASIWFIGLLS